MVTRWCFGNQFLVGLLDPDESRLLGAGIGDEQGRFRMWN